MALVKHLFFHVSSKRQVQQNKGGGWKEEKNTKLESHDNRCRACKGKERKKHIREDGLECLYLKHLEIGSYSKLFKTERAPLRGKLKFSLFPCLCLSIGHLCILSSKLDVFIPLSMCP